MFDYLENKNKVVPWERILRLIYHLPPDASWNFKTEKDVYKFFIKNTLHSEMQVEMALDFLEKHKLISIKGKKGDIIFELTPKGFEVASSNERYEEEFQNQRRQENININLMDATRITALSSALAIFVSMLNLILNSTREGSAYIIGVAVFGLIIAVLTGLLTKEVLQFLFSKP